MKGLIALLSLPLTFEAIAFKLKVQIPGVFSNILPLVGHDEPVCESHKDRKPASVDISAPVETTATSYWLEEIEHRGVSAFNPDRSYQVFRNVKDFGAKGDGVTDDTAAIQQAMSSGGRCAPGRCESSTITPAIVYFPSGTYLISSSIIDYYYTQIIGNPNDLPTLRATAGFTGFGVIDGDQYQPGGKQGFGSTNLFFRQIRNLIIDLTHAPSASEITGIHWPTAQATSLQNIVFRMSEAQGTQQRGLFIENGSGGLLNDLVFYGGLRAAWLGNQQFTMRNCSFFNAVTAINQLWDWGWTYKSITVKNCGVGIDMTLNGADQGPQTVGSVTIIDSEFINTGMAIKTAHNAVSQPPSGGSLILENVRVENVPSIVEGPDGHSVLPGSAGTITVASWGQGHSYTPSGPVEFEGPLVRHIARPASLLSGEKYYERSKPQYANIPKSQFTSTRNSGARGDGITDDTIVLQQILNTAAQNGNIVFFDAGSYRITRTLFIPPNSKIVGESYSVILSSGPYFADINKPSPVVKVGNPGQKGTIEWSDMIVSTEGPQAGAILIEWNMASDGVPSGMWDVHTRIGGFTGSRLQVAQCLKTPQWATPPTVPRDSCMAAFMGMHITKSASNLYLENVWVWTADHDLDDARSTQITIYAARGLLVESTEGKIWLVGTSVEHFVLYQYQFVNTKDIFMGQIQTETPYFQPNPPATLPFSPLSEYHDPDFRSSCSGRPERNCASAWGLRIVDSRSLLVYGAGLYSFFDNYSTTCSARGNGAICQAAIFSLEGNRVNSIGVYNLNTVGSVVMIQRDGRGVADARDNNNDFSDTVAYFRS